MRLITSARVRAAALLLLEVAGLAIVLWDRNRARKSAYVRDTILDIISHARALG
jgi:hypothetical protein